MNSSTADLNTIMRLIDEAAAASLQEIRYIAKHVAGKVAARQGDIYVHMVASNHPHGPAITSRQLAIGNTQGSRHVIDGDSVTVYEGTTLPSWVRAGTPLGPCFHVRDRHQTNTHPEHAHNHLPPGWYQVTHQMDARTLRRVQD